MGRLWNDYKAKAKDIRPFLRTKLGSRLAILAIIDFIVLFFAPLLHGFVGTAIFGCVASVYLMLIWRRFDKEHVVVPALILCIIAFFVVVAVFMGVVFSTAAYTASDGRRQARRDRQRERDSQDQEQRYRDYRPGKRDTTIYNVDEDDFTDENAPADQKAYDLHDFE